MVLRTLYARLALAVLVLFLVVGCVFTLLMVYTMDMYQQEVSQKLHRDTASYIVANHDLSIEGLAAQASVNMLFESLMVVNPNVEVYLAPAGGQVSLRLSAREDAVSVNLTDTGCGIAPEDLPYIFDRFYQPHEERQASDGVGLGLAISRRILELHGSHIEAHIEPQRGASFRFDLPVYREDRPRRTSQAA